MTAPSKILFYFPLAMLTGTHTLIGMKQITAQFLWQRLKQRRGHRILAHGQTPKGCFSVWPDDEPVEWSLRYAEKEKLDALFDARESQGI